MMVLVTIFISMYEGDYHCKQLQSFIATEHGRCVWGGGGDSCIELHYSVSWLYEGTCCEVLHWLWVWLVWHVGNCGMLGVGKMSRMVIDKITAV